VNRILTIVCFALRFTAAIGFVVFALHWRSPILASIRMPALAAFIVAAIALIAFEMWWLLRKRHLRVAAISSLAVLLTASAGLALTLFYEAQFHWQRHQVLRADVTRIERLGRHLVVGYRDLDELRDLVERRAIAGVFVSAHNVHGKNTETIRSEIASLQDIRKRQGLPPLLVSTDQEGGVVSRISPPLPRQGSLGDLVRQHKDEAERRRAIQTFATEQGQALAGLGFNLNFSPVVDINHNIVNEDDRYTRIFQRAISDDPRVVTAVAADYCAALLQTGIHCTLKHFPGLGRVVEDTHLNDADLTTPSETLAAHDWTPFRALMHHAGAVTMLGHARLTAIDKTTPASFSKAVVSDLLRGEWGHDGVLITDDFNMSPAYASDGGLGGAVVQALNAGVDLILISYDGDQFYPAMHALLGADAAGRLQREQLARSDGRLRRLLRWPSVAP
jgi:beta-N-acetylhexosaminidase